MSEFIKPCRVVGGPHNGRTITIDVRAATITLADPADISLDQHMRSPVKLRIYKRHDIKDDDALGICTHEYHCTEPDPAEVAD